MKKHYRTENNCLNCGNVFEGHFCNNCGQENLELHEDFGHVMTHAVGDYFHFDEKFFHTLQPLLFKPGKLTVDYMAGKRTQYLHPIRMYIFISLVYFILLFSHGNNDQTFAPRQITSGQGLNVAIRGINDSKMLTPAQKQAAIEKLKRIGTKKDTVYTVAPFLQLSDSADKDTTYAQYLSDQAKLPADKRDGFIDRYIQKKVYEWKSKGENIAEGVSESFRHNFPKVMFVLLPLFAWFVKIAFRKNNKFYVEYLIYSFHLHCFVFLFLTIMILLKMVLPNSWRDVNEGLQLGAFIIIIWYVYRSLKVLYQRSRFRTITKMLGIGVMYCLSFTLCTIVLLAIIAIAS